MARARSGSLRDYVAANARKQREALGLTQEQVASLVGCSPRYFRSIEVGQVNLTLATLSLIANALEVEAHELLRPAHLVRRGRGRPAKKKR